MCFCKISQGEEDRGTLDRKSLYKPCVGTFAGLNLEPKTTKAIPKPPRPFQEVVRGN